ncbi:homoserine/homoserine lactone efflux protein [Grimontia sp. NTOU-MAR1]|uniref:homoserine/homoserine lactone efflux protein n=1 Tax=Grimontia sp. NTOU-MAR1 TaxID=3111011 RepID=UPI002DB977C7|nr:homoserine/homoserine lactone efflux protein [Grimontia sp. NTOU-MAR1]WRW00633.1 homoserine/homoserine lactone efflux protein [Grimontia sp. NTOU-MAR1]
MNVEIWMTFVVACLVLAISPGAGAVNTMATTMKYGFRHSLLSTAGLQVGNAINIVLVGVGLGTLLSQSETVFSVIKWLGVAYLIFLGIQKFRENNVSDMMAESNNRMDARALFFQSVIVNVTNPKGIVFLVALLPQFISPNAGYLNQMLILGITMLMVDTLVMTGYALLASNLAHWVGNEQRMRMMNKVFGGLFIGAGTVLASASRE